MLTRDYDHDNPDYVLRMLRKRNGAPDRNRTCNPLLRRQVLYPVELRALIQGVIGKYSASYFVALSAGGM